MRKVTRSTALAFRGLHPMTKANSSVSIENGVAYYALHGKIIAVYDKANHTLELADCGWQTNTTKDRLNGILEVFGLPYRIYQLNHAWFCALHGNKGEPWKGSRTFDTHDS